MSFPQPRLLFFAALLLVILLVFNLIQQEGKMPSARETSQLLLGKCKSAKVGKDACYAKELEEIAYKKGPDFAFEVVSLISAVDPESRDCHLAAHGIGYGFYKREGGKGEIPESFSQCAYGAYHGLLERISGERQAQEIFSICDLGPKIGCIHALGHLLLIEKSGNVRKALAECKSLEDLVYRHNCKSGVYMEYVTALALTEHGIVSEDFLDSAGRAEGLAVFCNSFGQEEAQACWQELAHAAISRFGNSLERIYEFCDSATSEGGGRLCKIHSTGLLTTNTDLEVSRSFCKSSEDFAFETECYEILLLTWPFDTRGEAKKAVSFCQKLEQRFQPSCFKAIGEAILQNQGLADLCSGLAPNLRRLCEGKEAGEIFFPWEEAS